MKTTLKWVAIMAALAMGAACSPSADATHASWGDLYAARSVAKVTNLKSLEQPGMF